MSTNWRFRDHRGFQQDAAVVIGAAGAVGALTWALPLTGATWWIMMAVGPLLALLVGQADREIPRRRLITVVTSALGAVLAGGELAGAGGRDGRDGGAMRCSSVCWRGWPRRRRWRSRTSSASPTGRSPGRSSTRA